ncbi:hypothetical protein B0H10DRAFT_2242095 [Mycena sp. CBHHK59/15]|nr:hypothetical protein B0H10DRAFT_2242095 [Mycena sp. CBHHK59/15]
MMTDVVGNPLRLAASTDASYRDADTIPSILDNPAMHIHMSDLITCDVILDMDIINVDSRKPEIQMAGRYCTIITQYQSGTCTSSEINRLVETAEGYLFVGDMCAHITDLGYNSVDSVFEAAIQRANSDDWLQISVRDMFGRVDGDTMYNGMGTGVAQ